MSTSAIIVTLVMAMLIGSISWLIPSPRERRQMELRQAAIQHGLKVKVTQLEAVIDQRTGQGVQCVAYQLLRFEGRVSHWQVARERHDYPADVASRGLPSGWFWSLGDLPAEPIRIFLNQHLKQLSPDVLAVESGAGGCMVYWQERGSMEDVAFLAQWLKQLAELETSLLALNEEEGVAL